MNSIYLGNAYAQRDADYARMEYEDGRMEWLEASMVEEWQQGWRLMGLSGIEASGKYGSLERAANDLVVAYDRQLKMEAAEAAAEAKAFDRGWI